MAITKKKDDLVKVGALFSKTSKTGLTYFTGKLEGGVKLVAFVSNGTNKETGETMNVINIYEQQDLEGAAKVTPKKLPF